MMCHSVLVVRHLLTKPGAPRSSLRPVRVSARIASLKWSRPEYAKRLSKIMGREVDYRKHPAEDFASLSIDFEADDGTLVLGEATTSWSFVGPGLRLSAELLGPEYSMSWNTLESGLKLFFSREVKGKLGEDLVEKQNAEMGQMPVVANEAAAYGPPLRPCVSYGREAGADIRRRPRDRKSTRLNSSHLVISYAVFCLK